MLVILMENQLIAPKKVCQTCLLADRNGQPRWKGGRLRCGHPIPKLSENQASVYECEMGFHIASVD
jgi:hypothetical protein